RDQARHHAPVHCRKRRAMYRGWTDRHLAGIPGCACPALLYALSRFCTEECGCVGNVSQLRSGIIFWHLSGLTRGQPRSHRRLEVRVMAIMTAAQARENFFAAIATLRSAKVRSALTILGIVIGVSSVISMAAIIQGLNKF